MPTMQLKLGPKDHGHRLTLEEFEDAEFEQGHKYEIVDGRLAVSDWANPAENVLDTWLFMNLLKYSKQQQTVLNFATNKPYVSIPSHPDTVVKPDLAGYQDVPMDRSLRGLRWRDLNPVIVGEVFVEGSPDKDLRRNIELYLDIPSVQEYWVLDGREDAAEPTLIQHRRYGKRWVVRSFAFGSTFTTKLLPGFALLIDPRK